MTRTLAVPLAVFTLLTVTPLRADLLWRDAFRESRRYERHSAPAWRGGGGRFRAGGDTARLIPPLSPLRRATIEAEVTVAKRIGSQFTTAGVAVYLDPGNFWQLLLVEGPNGIPYFELIEDYQGTHQAQVAVGSPAFLATEGAGDLKAWEYGKRYRMAVALSPERIEGTITDVATGSFWRRSYSFAVGRAVREGRPALIAGGTAGTFHSFLVEGSADTGEKLLELKPGKAGRVAILRDERNVVAPALAQAFTKAGFGATLVGWEELSAARLPQAKLDLLVLADARRLPVAARDQVVSLLCGAGKVLAIGAPAASELLAQTPDGWRDPAGWADAYARRLQRSPVTIRPDAWHRMAYQPTQPAAITLDPAAGEACWKITTDLQGYDGFIADTAGAFGADQDALIFEARGDDTTSQLAVECDEEDGSRWIATVDLTPQWRTYLLRPVDFPYWMDSPTKNRGWAGDRLNVGKAARIAFCLSGSHTQKVKAGPHTYWVRGLSTAAEKEGGRPDFRVPDVEALCPSYKLYPMNEVASLRAAPEQGVVSLGLKLPWTRPAYSPVWRERGRGVGRDRAWRWVPILEAYDRAGRKRGALLSLMVGDSTSPNAMWANLSVANPADALRPELLGPVVAAARAMAGGCFLLEGGAELFSYKPGEPVRLGARAVNAGRAAQEMALDVQVTDSRGAVAFRKRVPMRVSPGNDAEASWMWRPGKLDPRGCQVTTRLLRNGAPVDRITHRIEVTRTAPGRPEEFVRVQGSHFTLGGKKWFFKGINYWPSWMAGYPHLNVRTRECYDPEIIERDLSWLESIGVTAISAVQAIQPAYPDSLDAYRDQLDFLDRCLRHNIRCFFFLFNGRPYQGADVRKIQEYIQRAGIKDHPAVLCWELAWEPIEGPWGWGAGLEFMRAEWNRWTIERYGSAENAVADWGFDPRGAPADAVPMPTLEQCTQSGAWNRYVAAFARAFSDLISAGYRDVIQPLRAWDPKHLISFRGGACGIPSGAAFAHLHSVGVARHVDFLNPEGYNLQTGGWATPTPADDIRKGGLVTHYYRFISREKPVVWMEFGYTVNGFSGPWSRERLHVKPFELQRQKEEMEHFYSMFIESGARGAAPWWLPGGFRLGENSDFGLIEPDGSERPACRVLRDYLPRFERVQHRKPDAELSLDLDGHRWDAWGLYSAEYLKMAKAGRTPGLRTAGTGTDSATCPLTAVGGNPCSGHNPPQFLNAEFDRLEVKAGDGPWRAVSGGETVPVPAGSAVRCRSVVGNIGEAAWLAPGSGDAAGRVFLAGRGEYGLEFRAPIAADTPFLAAATVKEFTLIPAESGRTTVSFEMLSAGRTPFGERRTVVFAAQ